MTDKEQIMIDGVGVKKCDFFLLSNKYCGLYSTGCRFVPNCHFKQLARKTQECESLKEEIKILQDNFDTVTRDCNDLIEDLRQECDTLKSQLDFEVQQKECIEQECGELKRELDKEHLLMLEKQDKATKYFLVINGIKEYIYNNTDFDVNDSIQSKTSGYDILQIINGL